MNQNNRILSKEIAIKVIDFSLIGLKEPITKRYTFEINRKKIVVILGVNGSGKTTLMEGLLGIIPTKGFLEIEEKKGYLESNQEGKEGYQSQEVMIMGLAGTKNLFYKPKEKSYQKVYELMKELKIDFLWDKNYEELSLGQKKMIEFGKEMIRNPKLLFLDEPGIGLDLKYYERLIRYLKKKVREEDFTVVMSSHQPEYIMDIADEVLLIKKESYQYGAKEDLLREENLSELYGIKIQEKSYYNNLKEKKVLICNYNF